MSGATPSRRAVARVDMPASIDGSRHADPAIASRRVLVPSAIGGPAIGALLFGGQVADIAGPTMGTTWRVRLVASDVTRLDAHRRAIVDLLDALVADLSDWEADSALTGFNGSAIGCWQALPTSLVDVLVGAKAVHARSDGAFDPTVARAVGRWGFGPRGAGAAQSSSSPADGAPPPVAPADDGAIGFDAVEVDAGRLRARRLDDVAVDLCGIAKGYAVDRVSALLTARGVAHHLVEIGGELRGVGVKPDGLPWWVALEEPPIDGIDDPDGDIDAIDGMPFVAALHGLSVATSGDYRHFVVRDGRRLAHTIDPRTACPVVDAPAAVTVLHPTCMVADAEATAITVLGVDRGLAYAEAQGLAVRVVPRRGAARHSSAFAALLA